LVLLQRANGSYELTKHLASIFGVTLESLQQSLPSSLESIEKNAAYDLWSSALVVAFLLLTLNHLREDWKLLRDKTILWMTKQQKALGLPQEEFYSKFATVTLNPAQN